jgi:hypothetical protein
LKRLARDRELAEHPWINEAHFLSGAHLRDEVRVFLNGIFGFNYEHAAGHSKMDDPLANGLAVSIEIDCNVLSDAPSLRNTRTFKHGSDLVRRGFQGLMALADPDGFDNVSRNVLVKTTSDGFDFGEFGHKTSLSVGQSFSQLGEEAAD